MRFVLLVCCLGLMIPAAGSAWAQPQVQDMDGAINHGETVTILGTDFGAKSPAAPMRYDNFEDGTPGGALKPMDEGGWYTFEYTGVRPTYSQGRQRVPGEMSVIQDYSVSSNQTIGLKYMDVDTLYVSGWTYRDDFDGTAMSSENVKFWGNFTHAEPGDVFTNPQCRYDAYWATNSGHLYVNVENSGDPMARGDYAGPRAYLNEWFRLERYIAIGNPGEPNGSSWCAYNGDRFSEISGIFRHTNLSYNYWLIGQYFRKRPSSDQSLPEASVKTYWGELYVDNTRARIEIGNNINFEACTHREIQVPETWNDGQITFQVNQGTFPMGEDLFLFVVDENDRPSVGFPVTMNSQVTVSGPGQPGPPVRD